MKTKKGSGMIYVLLLVALSVAGAAIFMARNDEPDPLRDELKTLTTANNILAQRIEKLEKTPPPLPPVSNDSRIPEMATKIEKLEKRIEEVDQNRRADFATFQNHQLAQKHERHKPQLVRIDPESAPLLVDVVKNKDPILVTTNPKNVKGRGQDALLKRANVKPPELEK